MESETSLTTRKQTLRKQVARDLASYFDRLERGITIKDLAEKLDMHPRTLSRALKEENTLSQANLLKLYQEITGTKKIKELLNLIPTIVREVLLESPALLNQEQLNEEQSIDVNELLKVDQLALEIFLHAANSYLTLEYLQFQFGARGKEKLELLLKKNILSMKENRITLGGEQAIFDGDLIKNVSSYLLNQHFDATKSEEKDQNFISFFTEGLSEESYREWMRIEETAFKEKIQIAKKQKKKGPIKAFCFSVIDKMNKEKSTWLH